jgi:serine/threonine protein kinase
LFKHPEPFLLEKENLDKIRKLNHFHLIRHLATFGVGKKHYVVFPWAGGGNLRQYWKGHDQDKRTPELALWCLQQMLHMVSALEALHSINCRHGDLKPENILHFDVNSRLVIADVGVSKIHEHATKLRNTPTKSKATTPSYEAPEVITEREDARSRLYDMWSLGCVFLEFIIWFFHGYDSINNFSDARQPDPDLPSHFYTKTLERKAIIHPSVTEAITALQQDPRCKGDTALRAFINLIAEKLLRISVDDRDTAKKVFQTLKGIVQRAESNDVCLFNTTEDLPETPLVFQGARRKSIAWQGQPNNPAIPEERFVQPDHRD